MPYTNKTILAEIQKKRENMIDLVHKKGLANDDTIKCSQELDQLIYQYQLLFHRTQEQKGDRKIKQMVVWPKIEVIF
ncbi:aspartyl-phosphate phosphatase Spo0E family protein [Bacillus sp. V3B]|uniref:aspartyl-phosphate phosphatase Spo0E family protein n=1 Tax=Bacillus sp. V3B TaxID=2804915 RepID=UPI0021093A43|nr:aspartyl-phosphate phosphatase Spo0E family protein [Bacillus sp. V3B]